MAEEAKITKIYDDAVTSGLLPGISVFAGDKDGNLLYTHTAGKSSLRSPTGESHTSPGEPKFTSDTTICAIASLTKLLTSVAVLQCVEDGLLDLDADVKPSLLPQIGRYGIITSFDDDANAATFSELPEENKKITTRMLLTHTSGHEYDWFSPLLQKWRASRGEQPWTGPTVEHKSVLPLVFAPGRGFAYGAGHDWAGRIVEKVSGMSLDEFMRRRIWQPLGIEGNEAGFFLNKDETLKKRLADLSTLNEKGEGPAVDLPGFDLLFGGEECLGGGGMFCTPRAYYKFLSAILRRDGGLFRKEKSYEELFRPQLDDDLEGKLNEYLGLSETHVNFLRCGLPGESRKNWSFAGLICVEGQEGRFGKGTVVWGGVPSCQWWLDREMGVCGVAVCQVLPPMCPSIMELHQGFQRGVYGIVAEGSRRDV